MNFLTVRITLWNRRCGVSGLNFKFSILKVFSALIHHQIQNVHSRIQTRKTISFIFAFITHVFACTQFYFIP